jgi:hypothetical protein
LEKDMAWREAHIVKVGNIPGAYYDAPGVGIVLYLMKGFTYLVDALAAIAGPGAPLKAVDMAKIAVGIGPCVPNPDAVIDKETDVGISAEKP